MKNLIVILLLILTQWNELFSQDRSISIPTLKECFHLEYDFSTDANIFGSVWDLTIDFNNHVFVLDLKNKNIWKFNSNGELVTTFGTPGRGPGEFKWPQLIQCDNYNNIIVHDSGNKRFEIFDNDGHFIESRNFNKNVNNFCITSKGEYIVETIDLGMTKEGNSLVQLSKYSKDIVFEKILYETHIKCKVWKQNRDVKEIWPLRFGEELEWIIMDDDLIVLGETYQNKLKVINDGKIIKTIELPLNSTPVRKEDLANYYSDDIQLDEEHYNQILENVLKKETTSKTKPVFWKLYTIDGNFIVQTFDEIEDKIKLLKYNLEEELFSEVFYPKEIFFQ